MIATSTTAAEQRTVLENISWETFEAILKEIGDKRGSRLAYDEGTLEIMTPLFEHEIYKSNLGNLLIVLAEELNIEIKSGGSTTLKLKVVKKGIEPDNCYYIENESAVRGRVELDLQTAPPPDLAIEIDITSSSVNKFGIYASLRVPELWRYNGRILKFYQLVETEYIECECSIAFPFLSAMEMTRFVEQSKTIGEIALIKLFRDWLKTR